METTQPHTIPTDPQEQVEFLQQLMKRMGDRDLFPEKTARARKFLEGLKNSQQRLIQ
ncbi:hypothetical protein [Dyadobacter luticola]|uniref:hypothetical protein n=1 Tax=Dyadobacter luticola TaxID=1979387 RepID=UPI001486D716|nr:hypothetical protein [Dyadobacter luticola]